MGSVSIKNEAQCVASGGCHLGLETLSVWAGLRAEHLANGGVSEYVSAVLPPFQTERS